MLVDKYKNMAARDSDKNSVNHSFYNRLVKHANNETKSILVYPGQWHFLSAVSFSQSILTHSRLSVYTLNITHPLTNPANACELNPSLTASLSACHTAERYLLTQPVCLGEVGIDRETHYGFAHNTHHLILSKMKIEDKQFKQTRDAMFFPLTPLDLTRYTSPELKETGSEVSERFILVSFVRGEKNLEGIQKNGIFHRKLLDSGRSWSNFEIFQLYSPNTTITANNYSDY
jgi:hypothetical protein